MDKNAQYVALVIFGLLLLPSAINDLSEIGERRGVSARVRAHLGAAEEAMAAGDLDRGLAAYTEALSLRPTDEAALMGRLTIQAQRIATTTVNASRGEALSIRYLLESHLAKAGDHREMFILALAQLSSALGERADAAKWYSKATSYAGASSKAWSAQGSFQLERKELSAARTSLNKALEIDEKNANARLSLGMLLKTEKNYEQATQELERAATELRTAKAYFELGDVHLLGQKYEPAYSAFQLSAKAHGQPETQRGLLKRLAMAAINTQRSQEAVSYLQAALRLEQDLVTQLDLAAVYNRVGQFTAAMAQLEPIVKAFPGNVTARLLLMAALARSGNIAGAKNVGRTYLSVAKDDPKLKESVERITRALRELSASEKVKPIPPPEVTVEEALQGRRTTGSATTPGSTSAQPQGGPQ